jgi:hypothetical protein
VTIKVHLPIGWEKGAKLYPLNPDAIAKLSVDDSKILKFNRILSKCPDGCNGSRGRSSTIKRWLSTN